MDSAYFKEILDETETLFRNDNQDENIKDKIDANLMALSYLVDSIENIQLKKETKDKLVSYLVRFGMDPKKYDITTDLDEDEIVDSNDGNIHDDILKITKKIRSKTEEFNRLINQDEKILKYTSGNLFKNLVLSKDSLEKIRNNALAVSCFKIFVISMIIFFGMYFLIRFT